MLPTRVPHRLFRPSSLPAGIGILVLTAVFTAPVLGDRLKPETVEKFRQALQQDKNEIEKAKKDDPLLVYRKENLTKRAKALVSLGEMSRALLLPDWKLQPDAGDVREVDKEIFDQLVARFHEAVRAKLKDGSVAEQAGAASLIGETAAAARASAFNPVDLQTELSKLEPDLLRLLKLKSAPQAQAAAALALSNIQTSLTKPDTSKLAAALGELLSADNIEVRLAAIQALSNIAQVASQELHKTSRGGGDPRALLVDATATTIPVLGKTLASSQPLQVRRAGSEAMRMVSSYLKDFIWDPPKPDSGEYPPADRKWTDRENDKMKFERERQEGLREELARLGKAFLSQAPALSAATKDADLAVRFEALQILEEVGDAQRRFQRLQDSLPVEKGSTPPKPGEPPFEKVLREVLPAVTRALSDSQVKARLAAAEVLEVMGDTAIPALPEIVRAARDRDRYVRWCSARILGGMAFRKVYADASDKTRLSDAQLSMVLQALGRLLEDDDLGPRMSVAGSLERLGTAAEPVAGALWAAVNRGDPEFRVAALHSLEAIGPAAAEAGIAESGGLPALAQALGHADPQVRRAAAEAFAGFQSGLRPESNVPKFRRFLKNPKNDVNLALEQLLTDSDPDVRKAASEALLKP
jgi:HEAT repeat protein